MFVCLVRDSLSPPRPGVLEAVARSCSPRVEPHGDDVVVCDATGLTRVIGMPAVIAEEMRRLAWNRGVGVRVAIAGSRTTAWLLGHTRAGATIVPAGEDRRHLERVPLSALRTVPITLLTTKPGRAQARKGLEQSVAETLTTLERWGLTTLGDFARLPRADVLTRLGTVGGLLHLAACGDDGAPLVPQEEVRRFIERMELEWPIEGLEPLSFVLARLCDAISASLARADRGAVALMTRLTLVNKATHTRTLTLPTPMQDARTLRTLILLDLESHPPAAGIDVVELECEVTPGRIVQGSLLAYPVPTPENLSTLVARLQALAGESRVGRPVVVNSHDTRTFAMAEFGPFRLRDGSGAAGLAPSTSHVAPRTSHSVLRRLRHPAPIRVRLDKGTPVEVSLSAMGRAAVTSVSGPWRSSGQWWSHDAATWDRDEWDIELDTGAHYRIARDRQSDRWELEAEID